MPSLKLKYLHSGAAVYRPGDQFGPRLLADYEMVWVTAGGARYLADRQTYGAPAGSMLLTRPGFEERYDWDHEQASRHVFFHFNSDTWPEDWPDPPRWPVVRLCGNGDVKHAMFAHVMRLNEQRMDAGEPPSIELSRQVEGLISAFLHGDAVGQGAGADSVAERSPAVVRAMDWTRALLRESPDAGIDLDTLAAAAAVTPKHLCRLFARSVGRPPMQWVLDRRLEHARTLLRRSNLTVQEVAARCGFVSPFHFSRTFKRRYGRPPTVDRRLSD